MKGLKRFIFILGNFGSGKTEISINLALDGAEKGRTVLVDMDIINPYFKSSSKEELLTGKSGLIYDRKGYEGYISHLVEKNRRMLSYSLSSKRRMELERENSILENFKHLLNGEQN